MLPRRTVEPNPGVHMTCYDVTTLDCNRMVSQNERVEAIWRVDAVKA